MRDRGTGRNSSFQFFTCFLHPPSHTLLQHNLVSPPWTSLWQRAGAVPCCQQHRVTWGEGKGKREEEKEKGKGQREKGERKGKSLSMRRLSTSKQRKPLSSDIQSQEVFLVSDENSDSCDTCTASATIIIPTWKRSFFPCQCNTLAFKKWYGNNYKISSPGSPLWWCNLETNLGMVSVQVFDLV